ncbi:MAG: hypothetical protein U1A78_35725 [Polyangia bacterium]
MATLKPRSPRLAALLSLGLFAIAGGAGGCGAGWPAVMDPTDIPGIREGSPRISRVRDLGSVHIGKAGPLNAESDGMITVGELVLIEGSGFGKQPAVQIAGRPAEVRWRTDGGGIIVQVPLGTPAGSRRISVEAAGRRAEAQVALSRLGLVLDTRRGLLHTVQIGGGDKPSIAAAGTDLRLGGARSMVLSSDGAAAYVLQSDERGDRVAIIDVTAPGGPRLFDTRPLRHRAHSLAAAERAPVLAIVGSEQVTLWDTAEARRPSPWPVGALPDEAQASQEAALDPSGTLLALSIAEGNQVVLVDVRPGRTAVTPRLAGQLSALPSARLPLLRGLRFASDGETLWLAAGDSAQSRIAGHQPTRVLAVRVGAAEREGGQRTLSLLKNVELRELGAPLQLAVGRALPVASGTTIRTPPEQATLFLSTVAPSAFERRPADAALWRSDSSGNTSALLATKREILAALDVTADASLALTAGIAPGARGLTVTVSPTAGGTPASATLGPADESDLAPPFDSLRIALQP